MHAAQQLHAETMFVAGGLHIFRFGVIRLVVRTQEHYTLGGSGGILPQENFEI